MRKLLVIFLVLALLPLFGKDRCNILLSPLGGYSMLRDDYIISYFDNEGRLDTGKVERIAEYIGRYANGSREFAFWIDSEDSWRKLNPLQLMPIKPDYEDFYVYISDSYEWNWTEIARIYNHNGVKLWVSLFEHCGLRNNPWNPWTVAFGEKAFYSDSDRAKEARHQFIDSMLRAFHGKVVGFELVNEPRVQLCTPEFLADTFLYLIKKGVLPEDIILGIEYPLKERDALYSELYRKFRNIVVQELGSEWAQFFKDRCISPCHGMNMGNLKQMLGPNPPSGGTRNLLLSLDGWRNPRPGKKEVKEVFSYALEAKSKAAREGKISFEVIYGKQAQDPLDSIEGLIEAYYKFYGEYPENYKKYQEKLKVWELIRSIFFLLIWR